MLISKTLESRKVFNLSLIPRASCTEEGHMSILSYTNYLCVWHSIPTVRNNPQILFSNLLLLSSILSPSATMMKRKGERGSPCLIPLEALKGVEADPLTKIEKNTDETMFMTQLVQSSKNPKALRILAQKFQFNLSYDFYRSSLRSIPRFFEVLSE